MQLTSLTGKALFYQDEASLKHKILAMEETGGAEEATYAIRNLISSGKLVVSTTVRDRTTGRLTTSENRVEGPTMVFCTSTNPQIDPETRSRFFVIGIDESRQQTLDVLAWQRQRQTLEGLSDEQHVSAIRARHHRFQRLLRPLRVVNPLAPSLCYDDSRLQARRDQPKYLRLIQSVAFLRQFSKSLKSSDQSRVEYIEIDAADMAVADKLAASMLASSRDELSVPSRDLLGVLEALVNERLRSLETTDTRARDITFTRRDLREFSGWSNYRVHTHLKELVELEYVLVLSGHERSRHPYRLAQDIPQNANSSNPGQTAAAPVQERPSEHGT